MAFTVIARDNANEKTSSHTEAAAAYDQAVQLLQDGTSYVAIRDEEGQEYSTGDFAERYLDPVGKPSA